MQKNQEKQGLAGPFSSFDALSTTRFRNQTVSVGISPGTGAVAFLCASLDALSKNRSGIKSVLEGVSFDALSGVREEKWKFGFHLFYFPSNILIGT